MPRRPLSCLDNHGVLPRRPLQPSPGLGYSRVVSWPRALSVPPAAVHFQHCWHRAQLPRPAPGEVPLSTAAGSSGSAQARAERSGDGNADAGSGSAMKEASRQPGAAIIVVHEGNLSAFCRHHSPSRTTPAHAFLDKRRWFACGCLLIFLYLFSFLRS